MKRFLTIAVAVSCLVVVRNVPAHGPTYGYGFTISASPASPDVNQAPFTPGILNAYLWLKCCNLPESMEQGIAAAEFGVVSTNPGNFVAGFTPNPPWIICFPPFIACAVDCPCTNALLGTLLVFVSAPGSLCLGPSTTGTKAGVDCSAKPSLWPIDWVGLDFGGGFCSKGALCTEPVSVEDTSWGSVKSLYR